jgi:hypothetical protein
MRQLDVPDDQTWCLGWQEVYNCLRKQLRERSRLDVDGRESLVRWKEKLEKDGWAVLFKEDIIAENGRNVYAFAMSNSWQLGVCP